jgi:predicted enzyme related to lactoylglutathione lyase
MITKLASVTIYVDDIDRALAFYVDKLGLSKTADVRLPDGFRWVTVAPTVDAETRIQLEQVDDSDRAKQLHQAAGGGTTWVFYTDDCRRTFDELQARGVHITQDPTPRPYGVEATFEDLYGNTFALVQPL